MTIEITPRPRAPVTKTEILGYWVDASSDMVHVRLADKTANGEIAHEHHAQVNIKNAQGETRFVPQFRELSQLLVADGIVIGTVVEGPRGPKAEQPAPR